MKQSEYMPNLETLRRIPDGIILDMASREIVMQGQNSCICGWAIRESLGLAAGRTEPAAWHGRELEEEMADRFGGTEEEWAEVAYWGNGMPALEEAFARRVQEAVARS